MPDWPNAPPLTERCLLLLPGFESRPGHVRKLHASDLGLGVGFHQVHRFPKLLLQWHKCDEKRNSKLPPVAGSLLRRKSVWQDNAGSNRI